MPTLRSRKEYATGETPSRRTSRTPSSDGSNAPRKRQKSEAQDDQGRAASEECQTIRTSRGHKGLQKLFSAGDDVAVTVHTLSREEYELAAPGATEEDLTQEPARLSIQDGVRYFPFIKAANRFKQGLNGQREKSGLESSGSLTTIKINFECSQSLLNDIVKSLYNSKIHVDAQNIDDILAIADYLQADWLSYAVWDYIDKHRLDKEPVEVFKIAHDFGCQDLRYKATKIIARGSRGEAREMIACSSGFELEDQEAILKVFAKIKPLKEILELFGGGWNLGNSHVSLLISRFPKSAEVLNYLLDGEEKTKGQRHLGERCKLAAMLLKEKEKVAKLSWPYCMEWILDLEDLEYRFELDSREYVNVSATRRFVLCAKRSEEKWGLYISCNERWHPSDCAWVTVIDSHRSSEGTSLCMKPDLGSDPGQSYGWAAKLSDWIDQGKALCRNGRAIGIRLQVRANLDNYSSSDSSSDDEV